MKYRPVLFSGPMVRALLAGTKTQTRRVVKPQPIFYGENSPFARAINPEIIGKPWMPVGGVYQDRWPCKYGSIGDRLWVRETWRCFGGREYEYQKHQGSIRYRADAEPVEAICNEWRPSIFMPRWACRIELEITLIRVERLNEISEEDAIKEGAVQWWLESERLPVHGLAKNCFRLLWESINGNGSWDLNPWVWVIEFKKLEGAQ
jgi:hypothetical protein